MLNRITLRITVFLLMGLITGVAGVSADVFEQVFTGISLTRPVDLQHAGDGSDRLFVVEQRGVITVFENDPETAAATTFLDITAQVYDEYGETGLLGLAFHPEFPDSGYFYVDYTADDPLRTVVSRFTVSGNPDQADPASEMVLLEEVQPYANHNGGQVAFGPDGYLYVSFGDGGGVGDPLENGQDRTNLLGTIIRIDVDHPQAPAAYGVPQNNPFVGNDQGFREEIYAYGLRNPWRFSFDQLTGRLWVGDVGQSAFEEVDIIESGGNYGWNLMEGNSCYQSETCDTTGLVMPVIDYGRDEGVSITGGYVYHGNRAPSLKGAYIYADYGSGNMWALRYEDGSVTENELIMEDIMKISSFGVDQAGELYCLLLVGTVYKIAEEVTAVEDDTQYPAVFATAASFPNPFNSSTTLSFTIPSDGAVTVSVYNIAGQLVDTILQDRLSAGEHNIRWTPDGLSGGVYLLRVTAPGGGVTARMVYLP